MLRVAAAPCGVPADSTLDHSASRRNGGPSVPAMTKSIQPTQSERGQVLIITAASMIVLLGIAAIVIDLGFSWMLHRQEQNAADPAALAAARFIGVQDTVTGLQTFDS